MGSKDRILQIQKDMDHLTWRYEVIQELTQGITIGLEGQKLQDFQDLLFSYLKDVHQFTVSETEDEDMYTVTDEHSNGMGRLQFAHSRVLFLYSTKGTQHQKSTNVMFLFKFVSTFIKCYQTEVGF